MSQNLYLGEGRSIGIRMKAGLLLCKRDCRIFVTGVGLCLMMTKIVLFGCEVRVP